MPRGGGAGVSKATQLVSVPINCSETFVLQDTSPAGDRRLLRGSLERSSRRGPPHPKVVAITRNGLADIGFDDDGVWVDVTKFYMPPNAVRIVREAVERAMGVQL